VNVEPDAGTSAWFGRDATVVAPDLLGMVVRMGECSVVVTESEAYTADDPASHSFRGPTPRTMPMFGPPGRWYVYLIYGMHLCANISTGPDGDGQAVLLRAGVIVGRPGPGVVVEGPGRLTRRTGIDRDANGVVVDVIGTAWSGPVPAPTPRVGISVAVDWPRRWRLGPSITAAIAGGTHLDVSRRR
jgi:DNA-3-methyladenine glycosylase